jgi:DNA-binding GntR family transcriptional regulator
MATAAEAPHGSARDGRAAGLSAAQVADQLRKQIQRCELAPGEWLREARLCAEFQIGRSTVRRALRDLAEDGLVTLEENRGACVAVTTLQEVFDLFELRAGLYGVAARFTCIRGSATLVIEVLQMIDALLHAADSGTPADQLIQQSEMIFSRMSSTASVDAQKMIEAVRRKTRWHYSYLGLAEDPTGLGPIEHWRCVRMALAARDAVRASEGARNILYYMQNEVSRLMLARGLGMQESAEASAPLRRTAAR